MCMINSKILYLFFLVTFWVVAASCSQTAPNLAKNIHSTENLSQVDEKLYRSSQPSVMEFQALQQYGIKNVIDLRQWHSDTSKLEKAIIKHYKFPLKASKVTYEDLVEMLATIDALKGKILVHCFHGYDRISVVVVAYRIGIEGWDKQKAVYEFTKKEFGYHEFWSPNLKELLLALDGKKFRKDIENYKRKLLREKRL